MSPEQMQQMMEVRALPPHDCERFCDDTTRRSPRLSPSLGAPHGQPLDPPPNPWQMSKNMDPSIMAQAQAMMSNPAMAQQAQQAMANISAEEMQSRLGAMPRGFGSGSAPALAAKPVSVAAQLRVSAMSIPEDVLELVEEAEASKLEGNNKFKAGEFEAAASRYRQGCKIIDSVLGKKALSGGDKKAVTELLDACQLNTANCRLKLEDWDGAKEMAEVVLARGENRKALFRRGQAYQQMGRLEEARADLIKAATMDPQDSVVASVLADVEAQLGVEPTPVAAPHVAGGGGVGRPMAGLPAGGMGGMGNMGGMGGMGGVAGMPLAANGQPDYKQMEAMLDQVSPEELKAQAAMLEGMDAAQLAAMAPQFAGMDPAHVKAMGSMMASMDPAAMKQMTKLASQMGSQMGGVGMPARLNASAAGPSAASGAVAPPLPPGLPALPAGMQLPGGGAPGLGQGVEMMANMSPEMMQAGIDMMTNMDPAALAGMAKMMGMDETQAAKMQQQMARMSPDDLKKWTGRAQAVAKLSARPVLWYRAISQYVSSAAVLATLIGALAVLVYGHVTETF
eukprot:scaffold15028_cov100-Isochrysis_galbana.AAC.4